MHIISLNYCDKRRNWDFNTLDFYKLTLLVGASGAGKTQILKTVDNIKKISKGDSLNGIKWRVKFELLDKRTYVWEGEFEVKTHSIFDVEDEEKEAKYEILSEQLISDNVKIIDRDSQKIMFNGKETVKLSSQQSAVFLLKEEELINPVFKEFGKIQMVNYAESLLASRMLLPEMIKAESLLKKYDTIDKVKESSLETCVKVFLASKLDENIFKSIKDRYIDIFPQVKDIKFAPIESFDAPSFMKDYPFIQIQEKNVENWISQEYISSGMYRSLMQISELYLCPEGSVLLMDEFENSLGVNCIDELTNDILNTERKIQFVLTSHHPYIINNIPYQNWKIVTRIAGHVTIKNASDYRIGNSKHDAFIQLLQLDEFSNGVD